MNYFKHEKPLLKQTHIRYQAYHLIRQTLVCLHKNHPILMSNTLLKNMILKRFQESENTHVVKKISLSSFRMSFFPNKNDEIFYKCLEQ